MKTATKEKKIKALVKGMLKESYRKADQKIDKAIRSGALNIEDWTPDNAPMVLPKIILTAILEDEARQYTGRGTCYEKKVKKEVRNLRYFLP